MVARAFAHSLFEVEVSANSVILCDIIIANLMLPLIPNDTVGFVGVESLQVIHHRLIFLLILHVIQKRHSFDSTSTAVE